MLYYKVKPTSDQIRIGIRFVNTFLIGNEIYTVREVEKAKEAGRITDAGIAQHLEPIELRKGDTHFCFGARFANYNVNKPYPFQSAMVC